MSHRTFARRLYVLLAATLAIIILAAIAYASAAEAATPTCQEDMPCWTWSTMGNLERGVIVGRDGRARRIGRAIPAQGRRHRAVTPCEYAFLAHEGLLDRRTPWLKGDLFASRHGCDYRYYG